MLVRRIGEDGLDERQDEPGPNYAVRAVFEER
jgi:hypothetical protein